VIAVVRSPGFLFAAAPSYPEFRYLLKSEGNSMPNAQKQQVVSELREIVSHSKGAILTDYRGLTVAEVTNLRRKLREQDAEYHIVKNTLFKIAIGVEELDPELDRLLSGPTAIAFAREDVVAPTKTVLDFLVALKKPDIKVKGGWIDGKVYTVEQVTALSKLPPKEQIVAQLVGTLNGPASEFVGTLSGIIGEFVRTIQAIADKSAEGAAPAGEAEAVPEAA
jgi:large subunit ribosomal protein L10